MDYYFNICFQDYFFSVKLTWHLCQSWLSKWGRFSEHSSYVYLTPYTNITLSYFCSFIIILKIKELNPLTLFFTKDWFRCSTLSLLPYKFQNYLFLQNYWLESTYKLGRIAILKILILPICEHDISLCLFRYSLISLTNDLQFPN